MIADSLPLAPAKVPGRLQRLAARCLRHPEYAARVARGYLLFVIARAERRFFTLRNVNLEPNVRVQRNASLFVDGDGGEIFIGRDAVVYEDSKLEVYGRGAIKVGAQSILGGVRIVSRYRVSIGARFLASWNVFIQDFDPHPLSPEERAVQVRSMAESFRPRFDGAADNARAALSSWSFPGTPVTIGDDVWVGANATILKGVSIGAGSIVAAGAVVAAGEYPPRCILAGNPARVVKLLEAEGEAPQTHSGGGLSR